MSADEDPRGEDGRGGEPRPRPPTPPEDPRSARDGAVDPEPSNRDEDVAREEPGL